MATTGPILGDDILLYITDTAIAHSTSHSLSLGKNLIDVTSKDTGSFEKSIAGRKNWSISCDGMVAYDAAYGYEDLFDAWLNDTELSVKFSTEESDDIYFTGTCLIESLEKNAPSGDKTTFSVTLRGISAIAKATVT
ncbi:MAG: phage tail tube protein [Bacteroidota bacterium]